MSNAFERAVEFQRENAVRRADRTVRTAHGLALFATDLPQVWFLNQVLVDIGTEAGAGELASEADSSLGAAGLSHRWISVDDGLGAKLADDFRALGWDVEEHLVMIHRRPPPPLRTRPVEEVTAEALAPVWADSWHADPSVRSAEAIAQLVEARYPHRNAHDVRYFAVRSGTDIAGCCELFSDGRTGQIENVLVLERYRGSGLGKAVTARALEVSLQLHDLTFLVADAGDWPQDLYRGLGFDPGGSTWTFTRRPGT